MSSVQGSHAISARETSGAATSASAKLISSNRKLHVAPLVANPDAQRGAKVQPKTVENAISDTTTVRPVMLVPRQSSAATSGLPSARGASRGNLLLSSIAFQYYPLDLNSESNPFIVSWWPRALADPALFHVSLQTASLDQELRSQKGFPISELLMTDSVSLVRRKIEDSSLAFQDETVNSVVTLAAIEHGKGNVEASRMHVEGVKRIVSIRGGINEVKRTSPLTARMVSWISLLVTGYPQFQTQDDFGTGNGIDSTLQWQLASMAPDLQEGVLDKLEIDPAIRNILTRLQSIFHQPQLSCLTTTELHDLTCFVVHKLLLLPPLSPAQPKQASISECLRYALVLYMLTIHGTTYYSHHYLVNTILLQLKRYFMTMAEENYTYGPLEIWAASVGMVASTSTADGQWFMDQASTAAVGLSLHSWEDVLAHLETVLWVRTGREAAFREKWEEIVSKTNRRAVGLTGTSEKEQLLADKWALLGATESSPN
ncbi:hypothetical protein V492_03374 [Pseudogymnoascus sp. VKM F-4246]|nr:hypothetical protein V492_03374 [Pseudogymnoascus sp. VKM F-4246]